MNWSKLVQVVMLGIFLMGSALVLSAAAQTPAPPPNGVLHDTEPGSVLVFPAYDIRDGRTTQIRITDTNDGPEFANSVFVKLNFVCPGIKPFGPCQELDIKISLTYHSTFVFDIPSFVRPPCDEGYIVAYVVSRTNDRPISYNHLIGSYHLDSTPPAEDVDPVERVTHAANAIAIQAVTATDFAPITPTTGLPVLTFDGAPGHYVQLASTLFSDFRAASAEVPDPVTGSELFLLTLDIISGAQNPATLVFIDFWNRFETEFSTTHEFVCWSRVRLDALDFNFRAVSLGAPYGSLEITSVPNCPFPGACRGPGGFVAYDPTILGAIREFGPEILNIRNLYHDNIAKATAYFPR